MTNKERLEEIENRIKLSKGLSVISRDEMLWLINRVKTLELALNRINIQWHQGKTANEWMDYINEVARRALADKGE